MNTNNQIACFRCEETEKSSLLDLYGYTVCKACESKLGLYQDPTIKKHVSSFEIARQFSPEKPTYAEEVDIRLRAMERDYIGKRLKLLHIQARLKDMA